MGNHAHTNIPLATSHPLVPRRSRHHVHQSVSTLAFPFISPAFVLGWHVLMRSSAGSVFSTFFRNGQVLETFRGRGVYQPSVDTAISKLSQGDWVRMLLSHSFCPKQSRSVVMLMLRGGQVHLFGEGRVCQPKTYIVENGRAKLRRFKWGMSVLLFPFPSLLLLIHPSISSQC